MIIVKLQGGMGNQMFQYAIAKSLSIKYNISFSMDRIYLDNVDWRNYDLDLFKIEEDFVTDFTGLYIINEAWDHFGFNEHIYNIFDHNNFRNKKVYLEGYFQNVRYFEHIEDLIKREFTLKSPITNERSLQLIENIRNSNSIMLNVRRTDFVNNAHHGTMNVEYYNKSIEIINSKVENPVYFIFSDDIEWCRENLYHIDNSFIVDHSYKGDRFGEYLELMKNCKHFIIPNSSFAWWSAYLSESKSKIVIAPEKWLSNSKIDIIDEKLNWIKI